MSDQDLQEKVARLASLPEHEWREGVTALFLKLNKAIDENTEITVNAEEANNRRFAGLEETNKQVLKILNAGEAGLRFLGWIGITLKWLTIFVGFFGAIFGAIVAGDKALDVIKGVSKLKGGP